MKREFFNKNASPEERLNHLERVVNRLAVRSKKTASAIIAPQSISTCVTGEDVKGDILKYMLFRGKINNGLVLFSKRPEQVVLEISVLSPECTISRTFNLNKVYEFLKLDIPTIDGSLVKVSIDTFSDKNKIEEVWLGMLWTPHVGNADVKKFLIDNLEKEAEDVSKE